MIKSFLTLIYNTINNNQKTKLRQTCKTPAIKRYTPLR